jgi:two-component system, NtrC family, sensor kinase
MLQRSPSLIRHTLLRTGVGGALLIGAITIVAYNLIFRAVEERGLIHLEEYVAERVKRENVRLEQMHDNIRIVVRAFVERYQAPDPVGYLDRFDRIFMRYPDGAVRNRPEHGDGTKDTTLWTNKNAKFTPS